jgi:hypothetical protein
VRLPKTAIRWIVVAVAAIVFVSAIVAVALAGTSVEAVGPKVRADPNTGPFQGLGTWIDIFDKTSWKDPRRSVAIMKSHGVRTLYIQTGNNAQKRAIARRGGMTKFLDDAHAAGIQVVAWYLPGFSDPGFDLHRVEEAISFHTRAGNSFDGFALDIESADVSDPVLRTARLLQMSDQIRAFAGETYPLGAIIPSPTGLRAHADYWPNFPYEELALRYDAVLPMSYFTWRDKSTTGPGQYVTQDLQILRAEVGSDALPIHIIGGLAQEAQMYGVRGFLGAVMRGDVIGESLYSFPGVTRSMWSALSQGSISRGTSSPQTPAT